MEMLQKIIDCESLENFPENDCDGVCFNKIASLCFTNCSSAITKFHHRFFSEYLPKSYIPETTTEFFPFGGFPKFRKSFCEISLSFLI